MSELSSKPRKTTLDKDLAKLVHVEEATTVVARSLVAPGMGLLFLCVAAIFAAVFALGEPRAVLIIAAAAIGAYMAMNIGANDVANNVGPAVGAKALTMGGALVLAAIFESAGALIAGGAVIDTISNDIIALSSVGAPDTFIRAMLAALIASALWINLATWIGAPVSTTHAIVGAVVGAGIAAAGFAAVNWVTISTIALGWIISPVLAGVVAAAFLAFVETTIVYQDDKITAAKRWVPLLIALMAASFTAYLSSKGLPHLIDMHGLHLTAVGLTSFLIIWALARYYVQSLSAGMENRNQSLRQLFKLPLIVSAALLSFGHGANDVANVVGPLAAIVHAAQDNLVDAQIVIPFWVMIIGAFGISLGVFLFGPKLIRMVGGQITKLNPMRAFCVALSTAITVLIATALGLPVSSTHIAVGAVFGVGFFREWYTVHSRHRRAYMERRNRERREAMLGAGYSDRAVPMLTSSGPSTEEIRRRRLVRRAHVTTIVAAWVTTVPLSALLAAAVFFLLHFVI